MTLIDDTIRLVEENGDLVYMPELLRMKSRVLLSFKPSKLNEAERCFTQSLEWSRRQGALAWELRTAIDLAKLLAERKQRKQARTILQPLFEQLRGDQQSADIEVARQLLASL